jgi:thiamine pyrophosphate-dependent acetolactate synthase large subunit-like protein
MGALGLAKELAGAGVSIVFANPGTSEMGILAGLDGISGKHSSHSAGKR